MIVGGAYFGDQAIPLANALRGPGLCHAFEPDADQARMLARNAERNGLGNVRVSCLGLWDDDSVRLRLTGEDALATADARTRRRLVPRHHARHVPRPGRASRSPS